MSIILVHSLEIFLLALALYLAYRVLNLAQRECKEYISPPQFGGAKGDLKAKINSTRESQIFAGIQLFHIKKKGLNPKDDSVTWLHEGICHFLLGATDRISSQHNCDMEDKLNVMSFVLTRNLELDSLKANQIINNIKRNKGINLEAYQAGNSAAEKWLDAKHTPVEYSLYSQISNWGLIS